VFLTSSGSRLPMAALALQAAGDAVILSEGEIGDEAVAMRRTFDLGEGFEAVVRLGEILPMPGWPGVHADVVLPVPNGKSDGEDVALRAALAEARKAPEAAPAATPASAAARAGQPLPDAVWRPDPVYRDLKDPSLEHRLLAAFRIWNVIHYFYPYRHLIGDWDAVLPQFIPRMEAADGARDYALAVSEMMTHVPDGHTGVSGAELLSIFGEAFLPVSLRWIEGSYVVTSVWGGAKDAGIEVGDVLVAVDGQPAEARAEFFGRILTASTEAALRNRIGGALLRGPNGSTATLTLRGRDGATREVKATRAPFSLPPPSEETVRILPGGIGLVDLRQLERAEVDAMFDKVKDTRALIFDLRGYPRGTAWSIAPRLNVRGATVGATFRRPQVDGFSSQRMATEFAFSQPLPVSDKPKYTRPTVMLIDDRTISQAEHTGLFFEAAAGTVFIGTPTAGANGDVTNFFIPGGIRIGFTGHDVRHADGRQLQRVGLQPAVEVAPTLEGIRAGRDEVLEAALRYLEEKAPAP
jgi:C-terminal processing protease CtpA/Prc